MSKRQLIMILGVIVAIIQFLGFPSSWNRFFVFVCGILIVGIAYKMAPKSKPVDMKTFSYVEHRRGEMGDITNHTESAGERT